MLEAKTAATREAAASHSLASASSPPQSETATITSALAADPHLAPSKAAKRLFPDAPAWKRAILRFKIKEELQEGRGKKWNWHKGAVHPGNVEPNDAELEGVRKQYGYKAEQEGGPSRLYTMVSQPALRNEMQCSLTLPP